MDNPLYEAFAKQYEDWKINETYDVEILLSRIELPVFDKLAFEKAYYTVLEKHESLRTIFVYQEDKLYQQVLPGTAAEGFAPEYPEGSITDTKLMPELMRSMRHLGTSPLFRIFVRIHKPGASIFIALHHIISDEWSVKVLIEDLTAAYTSWLDGIPPIVVPVALQLKDYSRIKNEEWYHHREERVAYWHKKLDTSLLSSLQARLIQRMHQQGLTFSGTPGKYDNIIKTQLNIPGKAMQYACPLSPETYAALQQLSGSLRISRLGILLTAAALLFYTAEQQQDIMISTLAGDRFKKQTAQLIGHLMGGTFLRYQINGTLTVQQTIHKMYMEFIHSLKYLLLNYDDFRDTPLQSASLLHVNYLNESFSNQSWEKPVWGHTPIDLVFYPLSIVMADSGKDCYFLWNYHTGFYAPDTIASLATSYDQLLAWMAAHPETEVDDFFI